MARQCDAQWINYPDKDIPRLKDGKPNLSAPAPHAADGKPDLTGVWAHELTPVAEFKRMLGASYEAESQAALIGMELEAVHKYGLNIFADLKPEEYPLRPEGEALMKKRNAERSPDNVCHGEYGWPVAGLLAEPFKFVQTPKLSLILYEVDNLRRQIFTRWTRLSERVRVSGVSRILHRALGGRHLRRRVARIQRQDAAGRHGASAQ